MVTQPVSEWPVSEWPVSECERRLRLLTAAEAEELLGALHNADVTHYLLRTAPSVATMKMRSDILTKLGVFG